MTHTHESAATVARPKFTGEASMSRRVASLAGACVGTILWVIGMLAPLTPSYGVPTATDVGVFLVLPILFLLASTFAATSSVGRILCGLVLLLVAPTGIGTLMVVYSGR